MQNQSGTGKDPMAQLDQAMAETFQELERQGSGVTPSDVVREAPPDSSRPAPRRREREVPQDDDEQEQPRRRQQQQPRRRASREPASQVILDEADDQDDEDAQTPRADARPRRRREQRDDAPARGPDGRFLPSRHEADADDDDDLEEDDDTVAGGRYAEPEEVDVDDDDVEPEGRGRARDDEDEDADRGERRGGRRRWPKNVRQDIEREVARQVEARVSKVIEERDQLRVAQAQTEAAETEAIDFLVKAIGTEQQRAELQATVNNPRLPLEQRNRAAATLTRYQANQKYAQTYRTALVGVERREKADRRQKGIEHLGRYQIQLDPQIIHAGDDANTMAHVARQAILAERKRAAAENERLRRQLATRNGVRDERAVRSGGFGRDSLATANGRRANGRVAVADPLRRAMGYERGLGRDSQVPMPTDEILRQLRDNEITLRDLGLDE